MPEIIDTECCALSHMVGVGVDSKEQWIRSEIEEQFRLAEEPPCGEEWEDYDVTRRPDPYFFRKCEKDHLCFDCRDYEGEENPAPNLFTVLTPEDRKGGRLPRLLRKMGWRLVADDLSRRLEKWKGKLHVYLLRKEDYIPLKKKGA